VNSVTQPKRRMSAPERREAILAAALDTFSSAGFHDTSLEQVARRAGISKALIYEHFASKRDLHAALLDTYIHELLARVTEAIAAASPGEERLRTGTEAFLRFVEQRRDAWRMLVRNIGDADVAAAFDRLMHEVAAAITVQMAADAPPEPPAEAIPQEVAIEMLAQQLIGALLGLANWWDEHREMPRDHVLEMAMDFIWIGLEGIENGRRWGGAATEG
jgi:AcrR family transcriptional regulator